MFRALEEGAVCCALLGSSWGHLGAILASCWGHRGGILGHLGVILGHLGVKAQLS